MNANVNRARAIFVAAVGQVAPERWDAYLAEACAGDEELLGRVKRLLQAHVETGHLLEAPARLTVTPVEGSSGREGPGTMLGPYLLLRELGEGGMGRVWVAEQTQPVRRQVALKVV